MSLKRMLNKTMKIKRLATPTLDSTGGAVITEYGTTTAKCRIRLLAAAERTVSGREGIVSSHMIYAPTGTVVASNDVVRVNEEDYDVQYVNNPHGMNKFLQIEVALRR